MQDVIDGLLARVGHYEGHGIDHEEQPFYGELLVEPLFPELGVAYQFRALGIDGTVYRDERGWVARDDTGQVALWTIHAAGRGVRKHAFRHLAPTEGPEHCLVFGVGEPAEVDTHRVEVAIELWADGDVGYRLSQGNPGGPFELRSSVRMEPLASEGEE